MGYTYSGPLDGSPARTAKQGTVGREPAPSPGGNRADRQDVRAGGPVRQYSRTVSIQAPSGFDYSPRSRNSEVTLMEWFLILTIRVPLAICLVAQVQ